MTAMTVTVGLRKGWRRPLMCLAVIGLVLPERWTLAVFRALMRFAVVVKSS